MRILREAAVPPCPDPSKPVMLGFTPEAWGALEPLLNTMAGEAEASPPARAQWLGKLRGNVIRLAGVLHVVDDVLLLAKAAIGRLEVYRGGALRRRHALLRLAHQRR